MTFPPLTILDRAAGLLHDPLRREKVAIIGAGQLRRLAPFDDPTWLVWGINEISQPRADAWFELHPMSKQNARELAWLKAQPAPVYVLEETPLVPQGVRYPLDWVLQAIMGRRYFTCTFAFQIALAIAQCFREIGLWGVDLDLGTRRERLVEKPCVEYWLGMAEGRGIRVRLPEGGTLLHRPYLYGYDYDAEKADIEGVCEDVIGR